MKPGNVLVGESGRPKVIDFGIARATDRGRETNRPLAGTLAYPADEERRR